MPSQCAVSKSIVLCYVSAKSAAPSQEGSMGVYSLEARD